MIRCKKYLPKTWKRTKKQTAEMTNTLEGIKSRITEAEERINDLEKRSFCSPEWWKSLPQNRIQKKEKRKEKK